MCVRFAITSHVSRSSLLYVAAFKQTCNSLLIVVAVGFFSPFLGFFKNTVLQKK